MLRRRRAQYTPLRTPVDPRDRIVIVVDDGIATGSTMTAALRIRTKQPKKLVGAVAVASAHAARTMSRECDAMVCLNVPLDFHAVGQFFDDFAQVSNREVIEILREVTRTFLQSGKSGEVAMRPDGAVEQSLVKRNSPTGKNPIAQWAIA